MSTRVCTVEGCDRPHRARGWCSKHYLQWLNAGKSGQPVERVRHETCTVEGCTQPPRSGFALYCERHYGRLRRTGTTAPRPNSPVDPGTLRLCQQCGVVPVRVRFCFCSDRCSRRAREGIDESVIRDCFECGGPIAADRRSDAVFCSVRCGLAARSGRHTSAPLGGAAFLGRRDGWFCHLCQQPVDPQIRWPHKRCGTVDHVVAVSRGGADDPANFALAHMVCNVQKGNRS